MTWIPATYSCGPAVFGGLMGNEMATGSEKAKKPFYATLCGRVEDYVDAIEGQASS